MLYTAAISTDALHVRDSSRNESPPQRRPILRTNWEDGYIEEEDASVTLSSDTRMTALVSLDLRTLSHAWKDALSAVSDIVSLLAVTFSGGEELLVRILQTFFIFLFSTSFNVCVVMVMNNIKVTEKTEIEN